MTNEEQEFEHLFVKLNIDAIKGGIGKEVGANAFLVLSVISAHVNNEGIAFPSIQTIGNLTGLSKSTILRALKRLQDYRSDEGNPILYKTTMRKGQMKTQNVYIVKGVFSFGTDGDLTV